MCLKRPYLWRCCLSLCVFYICLLHCICLLLCSLVLLHLSLLVSKCCKVGHYPLDKPGQRSFRIKEEEPIQLFTHICAFIHWDTVKPTKYLNTPTRLVNFTSMCVSLSCSVWLGLSFTHTLKQNAFNSSILISVGSGMLIMEQQSVRTN